MPDPRYEADILLSLLQDLAELSLRTRQVESVQDGDWQLVADRVEQLTTQEITSKSLRNLREYALELPSAPTTAPTAGNHRRARDLVAAAWLVAMGLTTTADVKAKPKRGHRFRGRFLECIKVHQNRRDEMSTRLADEEEETLEYKDTLPDEQYLARLFSAFANTDGGLLVVGVTSNEETNIRKIRTLTGREDALTKTLAALGRLSHPIPSIRYGWAITRSDKTYVVQIPDNNPNRRHVRARTDEGIIAYERNGDETRPIGMVRTSLYGPKRHTTESRMRLIENYRSVLSLIDNIQRPHSTKSAAISRRAKKTVALLSLNFVVETFVTFMSDLLSEINRRHAKDDQHLLKDLDTIAKQKTAALREGRVDDFLLSLKSMPGVLDFREGEPSLPSVIDVLQGAELVVERVFLLASMWRRSGALADAEVVATTGGTNVESKITLTSLKQCVMDLHEVARALDSSVFERYHLNDLMWPDLPGQ